MFNIIKYPLNIFKFLPEKENLEYDGNEDKEILLIGAHRMGAVILKELIPKKDKLLVIDYNPEIIKLLMKKKVSCVYGDVLSPEMLTKLDAKKIKLIISTVPNYEENLHLLKMMKRANSKTKVLLTGTRISDAKKLYKEGADFVIMPKVIAGEELAEIIHSESPNLKKAKKDHLKRLDDIHNILY